IAEKQDPVPLLVGLQDQYAGSAGHCADQPMSCALLGTGVASEVILPGYSAAAAARPNFDEIAIRVTLDQATAARLVPAGSVATLQADLQKWFPRIRGMIDDAISRGNKVKPGMKPQDITAYASALTSIPIAMTGA